MHVLISYVVFFIQRAILKFARYTGAHPIAGRFTPGTFTNQIQAAFREPRILVVSDPRADHQVQTARVECMYEICIEKPLLRTTGIKSISLLDREVHVY